MLREAADGRLVKGDSGKDKGIDSAEDDDTGKDAYDFEPVFSSSCAGEEISGFLKRIFGQKAGPPFGERRDKRDIYRTGPKLERGQMRKMILPTICSWETQPTAVFLESTEVERWSPITKKRPSGTW